MKLTKVQIVSLVLLCIWLWRPWIFRLLHIDFSHFDYVRSYRSMWLVLFPISVFGLVFGSSVFFQYKWAFKEKMIGISAASICYVYMVVSVNSICESMYLPVNKNKNDPREIMIRRLDCGAFDGGSDPLKYVEIQHLGKYFIHYSEVDKPDINREE